MTQTTTWRDNPAFSLMYFIGIIIRIFLMPKEENTEYSPSPEEIRRDTSQITGKFSSLSQFISETSMPDVHSPFAGQCGLKAIPAPLSYGYCRGRLKDFLDWKMKGSSAHA